MKLQPLSQASDLGAVFAGLDQQEERVFALTATDEESAALLHDLNGTIRTFRYIVGCYGQTLPDSDAQKTAKLEQLEARLTELAKLQQLLTPLLHSAKPEGPEA